MADELVDAVFATTSVFAWVRFAFIHITQASGIVVTSRTFASEAVHEVYAHATVGARVGCTFVDVVFAMSSSVAR